MVGISLFSREILELVFASQGAGIDISAPLLACLGLSVTTSVLITLTNAMLQAYNSAAMPIISMAVGCTLKIILSFVLIGNRSINIMGAPIGTFFCDIMICLLNFVFLSRRFKGKISFKETLLEPSVFAFASILPAFFLMRRLQKIFDGRIITVACICISGIVYLILAGRKILKIKDIGV
jgi:stage V sporulation protein B